MSGDEAPPEWRLPLGVNASLWRYTHSLAIAEDEDHYFRDHPLFRVDQEAVAARFQPPGRLIDLGCGAGRMTVAMARRGFDVVGVEMSRPLLEVVRAKAEQQGVKVRCVKANLCRLGCFADGSFTHALSLFSTLGMIRGQAARREALGEAARVLEPGGRLAIHAHNHWINAGTWEGRRWLVSQALKAMKGADDAGDRRMTYRGIPGMQVHLYGWWELKRELRRAGFRVEEVLAIDRVTAEPITWPRVVPSIRAGGWIVFARKAAGPEDRGY